MFSSALLALAALTLPTLDGIEKGVVFLLMLSTLVVLHEGGHFVLARLNGVRVNDFAVGFGPTLVKWTSSRSGTNYRLNLLPIGGYCAMQGEDGKTSEARQQHTFRQEAATAESPAAQDTDNFQAKSPLGRLSIVVAGPLANFLLAYLILFVAAVTFGIASTSSSTIIGPLQPGSPGALAGLQVGDRLVMIDGIVYANGDKLVDKIRASAGVPLRFTFLRAGALHEATVTPRAERENKKVIGRVGFLRIPQFSRVGIVPALSIAGRETYDMVASQLGSWKLLVAHPARYASSLSGPIGMERAAANYQALGWGPYLTLAATISVALGILNLFPFPALDGGRAVFILAEMLRGRPVEPEREALVHITGLAVLMALMVLITYHDIANIVSGKGIF